MRPEKQAKLDEGLLNAAQEGNAEKVKELIEAKADVNATIVQTAIRAGGANVNLPYYQGNTPLHLGVKNGNATIVQTAIKAGGANVNLPYYQGNTPLHLGVKNGNAAIVKELIAQQADTNANGPVEFAKKVAKREGAAGGRGM